ncbi:MAG: hypothetical protein HQL82_10745 [Magnetococcales bacterium]|nr:hypothetical protein [Magnetococcales bacterium]
MSKQDRRGTDRRRFSLKNFLPAALRDQADQRQGKRRKGAAALDVKRLLFSLLRRSEVKGRVGLTVRADGIGLVHVVRRTGARPLVKVCRFIPNTGGGDGGAELFALIQTLKSLELLKGAFVGLLFPGQYQIFPAEAPQVPREELATAMRWRIKDRLDFPVADAVVDVFDLPGSRGGGEMIYVVATQTGHVRGCARLFHDAGLTLAAIDILELALRNLTVLTRDDADGLGLLFMDRRDGLVLVTKGGVLYLARPIEQGVEQLLESLDGRAMVDAQEMVRSPVLDTLSLEVQRTMDYFESHFGQPPVSCIHVAPTPVPFPGLQGALAEKLGMRIKNLPVTDILEWEDEVDAMDLARCLPALGAALREEG